MPDYKARFTFETDVDRNPITVTNLYDSDRNPHSNARNNAQRTAEEMAEAIADHNELYIVKVEVFKI